MFDQIFLIFLMVIILVVILFTSQKEHYKRPNKQLQEAINLAREGLATQHYQDNPCVKCLQKSFYDCGKVKTKPGGFIGDFIHNKAYYACQDVTFGGACEKECSKY